MHDASNNEQKPYRKYSTLDMVENGIVSVLNNDLTIIDNATWEELCEMTSAKGFLFMALCTEGEAVFMLGGRERHIQTNNLLISFGEPIVYKQDASSTAKVKAVVMSHSYAGNCIVGLDKMWPYLLFVMENPVLSLTEEELEWIRTCYLIIKKRVTRHAGRYMRETTISLVRAFYFEICNLLDSRTQPDMSGTQNRAYAIFDQFIKLASQNFKRERSVEWYSNEMCLTPKHLSEVVKQVSGKTAGQWITTLVIIEIKSLLSLSSLSIKEIAQEMNFPNQSFLGKYFKNIEGISPSDFRKG